MAFRLATVVYSLAILPIMGVAQENAVAQREASLPPLIGIDHIPLAVKNLEQASDSYRRLGFALKPGRFQSRRQCQPHDDQPPRVGPRPQTAGLAIDRPPGLHGGLPRTTRRWIGGFHSGYRERTRVLEGPGAW